MMDSKLCGLERDLISSSREFAEHSVPPNNKPTYCLYAKEIISELSLLYSNLSDLVLAERVAVL